LHGNIVRHNFYAKNNIKIKSLGLHCLQNRRGAEIVRNLYLKSDQYI